MRRVGLLVLLVASAFTVAPGLWHSDPTVVLFRDYCDNRLYVIDPADGNRRLLTDIVLLGPVDVSRGVAPVTALAYGEKVPYEFRSRTLYAITVDGSRGPVDLFPGESEPKLLIWPAVFAPDGGRIAFVARKVGWETGDGWEVYIGDVTRDATTNEVTGLTNVTFVVDLKTIGQPSDSDALLSSWTGMLDFARNGDGLVATIYDDLWKITLAADGHTFAGATPLTRTKSFAERYPRWSPKSDLIAFHGGPYKYNGWTERYELYSDNTNIYTVDANTGSVRQVTTNKNAGPAGKNRNHPAWSPDGGAIIFSAHGSMAPGNSTCGSYTNFDLFQIPSDGSTNAVVVTQTTGTGVEVDPSWGWPPPPA